jgi:hypothetical protein
MLLKFIFIIDNFFYSFSVKLFVNCCIILFIFYVQHTRGCFHLCFLTCIVSGCCLGCNVSCCLYHGVFLMLILYAESCWRKFSSDIDMGFEVLVVWVSLSFMFIESGKCAFVIKHNMSPLLWFLLLKFIQIEYDFLNTTYQVYKQRKSMLQSHLLCIFVFSWRNL